MWNFVILLIKINNLWKLAVKIIITKWMFNRNTSFYRSTYEAIKHTYKLDTNGASRRRPPPPVLYRTVLYRTVLYCTLHLLGAASDGRLPTNLTILLNAASAGGPRRPRAGRRHFIIKLHLIQFMYVAYVMLSRNAPTKQSSRCNLLV